MNTTADNRMLTYLVYRLYNVKYSQQGMFRAQAWLACNKNKILIIHRAAQEKAGVKIIMIIILT